jgi:hypothetical protein
MRGTVIDEGTCSKISSVHNPQENPSVPETKRSLVLAAISLDSFTLGVPDTPLLILEFVQTPDGGIEFTMGTGILAVGVFIGICYAYLRASGRHWRMCGRPQYSSVSLFVFQLPRAVGL